MKALLYSQASITKYGLSEKWAFLLLNSFKIVQITAFTQKLEFFNIIETIDVVVDLP
jgi:hypothetical protein